MKRPLLFIIIALLVFLVVPAIPWVRAILAAPLIVSDENASGDACYVLAGGSAIWERLAAASDLYHMNRIRKIFLMNNSSTGPYNFPAKASWNQTQWVLEYLISRGVPKPDIVTIQKAEGRFGTLTEARNLAQSLPPDVKRLVLVTSAPHTRRSRLIFRRFLPGNVTVGSYSATTFETSAEFYDPLWLEYLKLLVYGLFLFP